MIAALHRELLAGGGGRGDPGALHDRPAPNPSLPFDLFRPYLVMISKVLKLDSRLLQGSCVFLTRSWICHCSCRIHDRLCGMEQIQGRHSLRTEVLFSCGVEIRRFARAELQQTKVKGVDMVFV